MSDMRSKEGGEKPVYPQPRADPGIGLCHLCGEPVPAEDICWDLEGRLYHRLCRDEWNSYNE